MFDPMAWSGTGPSWGVSVSYRPAAGPVPPVSPVRPASAQSVPAPAVSGPASAAPVPVDRAIPQGQPGSTGRYTDPAQRFDRFDRTAFAPFPGFARDRERPGMPRSPGGEEGNGPEGATGPGRDTAADAAKAIEGCQTCKSRKYQDGSDDPGVSFKTPTKMSPDQAASAVRGHEMEHVTRNQAEARREGRKVVSQSVTYHTAICPECGRTYVSGGTTRTTTKGVSEQPKPSQNGGGRRGLDLYA